MLLEYAKVKTGIVYSQTVIGQGRCQIMVVLQKNHYDLRKILQQTLALLFFSFRYDLNRHFVIMRTLFQQFSTKASNFIRLLKIYSFIFKGVNDLTVDFNKRNTVTLVNYGIIHK